MGKVVGFAIAALFPFLLADALLTPRPLTSSRTVDVVGGQDGALIPAPEEWKATFATSPDDDEDHNLDLQGNPVSAAVATYKLDAAGSLYETHSPRTELPRLGSPKS